ncbi:hypothetical protein [Streptomyces sp. NPDC050704]|uniref:hypothetical protein n=1 Tax=Streptomyces sp. NPDC050704 TaxID=3157219 RepID=UPI0034204701
MSITEQYLLDTYRALRHGDPTPPAPGANDWQVVRELCDHRRFRAVPAGRPVRRRVRRVRRVRAALGRLFGFGKGSREATEPLGESVGQGRPGGVSRAAAPRSPRPQT